MATIHKAQNAEQVVQAIVNYFGSDTERVLAFYEAIDPALRNINPEIDAIIDGIDNWLIGQWPSSRKYTRLTWKDLIEEADDFDP
jgi:flavodoxin